MNRRRPRSLFIRLLLDACSTVSRRVKIFRRIRRRGADRIIRGGYTDSPPSPASPLWVSLFFYNNPWRFARRCFVTAGRTRSAANPLGRSGDTRSGRPRQLASATFSRSPPFICSLYFFSISLLIFYFCFPPKYFKFHSCKFSYSSSVVCKFVAVSFFWLQGTVFIFAIKSILNVI